MTHFAAETTLGFRRGFFGLIAEGWDIEDTTGKGARGPLPPEAGEAEMIVGLFFAERASGVIWTVDEFHEFAATVGTRKLSFDEIVRVKKKRSELFQQWAEVAPGATLDLGSTKYQWARHASPLPPDPFCRGRACPARPTFMGRGVCAGTRLTFSVFRSLTRLKKYAG